MNISGISILGIFILRWNVWVIQREDNAVYSQTLFLESIYHREFNLSYLPHLMPLKSHPVYYGDSILYIENRHHVIRYYTVDPFCGRQTSN